MIAAVLMLLASARAEERGPAPDPKTEASAGAEAGRVNLFLGGPGDLDALLQRLQQPDFVLLKGDEFRKLLERARVAAANDPTGVVDSVTMSGAVHADRADLSVEYGITLRSEGPTWVTIRLDDQTVTDASEGGRALPLQMAGGSWQVQLRGAGAHRVRVDLKVLLRTTIEGRRIDFAIPEAASTRFSCEVDDRVSDAITGSGELVEVASIAGGARSRLSAHLSPRPRLDVSWRVEAEPGVQLPPLLTMQGDIAIDIDAGTFRTRSTWAVHAVRGTTRSLELRLDPADEVLELELDGQPVPAGIERAEGATLLTIALNDPLRPGLPKSLVMTTRRPISTATPADIVFNGFTLTNAKEQSGAIGIAQSGNLWIGGTAGRGLRQIDPRTELSSDLRARPATTRAYVFADQPFELSLRIEPSPPLVRTDSRTTITLDAGQARVETWLKYQTAHGRLFDLKIGLPDGLELESVGPEEVVEGSQRHSAPAAGRARPLSNAIAAAGTRVVAVRLTPLAQEGDAFTIHLTGRKALDPTRPVDLALFQPLDSTSGGGRIAVLTGRNLTVDMRGDDDVDGDVAAGAFRTALQEPPADWPWPVDRTVGSLPPALWLRHDGSPASLPLEVTVHPRALSQRTSLSVQVERRLLLIEQETACTVHFGTLDHVDVEVPAPLRGRWEPEGNEVVRRIELGSTPAGDSLTRLVFGKEVRDEFRLRFRLRRPLSLGPDDRPTELEVPWIRLVGGTVLPMQVRVASEPGIDLKSRGEGWVRVGEEATAPPGESGLPVRFALESDAATPPPLGLVAAAHPVAALPPLVASRLWLRTIQGPESDLRTTAIYKVETHASMLSVALPPGAVWVGAKIGGAKLDGVEELPKGAGYRLQFSDRTSKGPVVVELDYTIPATRAKGTWIAPRLLDGGLVQQSQWEIRIPWGRALIGVPPGWIDENRWVWEGYSFRRRPRQTASTPTAWTGGPSPDEAAAESVDVAASGDDPIYLFGRPGPPTDLNVGIASRGWLVGICSGTVLAVGGLLILYRRPSPNLAWGVAMALGLAVVTLVEPSVTILAVQSAMIGVVLTLLTALMQWLVNRRRLAPIFGEPGGLTGVAAPGSTVNRTVGVGSDDSTAIRVRPVSSTVDHYVTGPPSPPE